jgi:hypothetical protein
MSARSQRPPFAAVRVRLVGPKQLEHAIAQLRRAPLDPLRPLELLIREEVRGRKPDQNALMWAGPLRDIAEQVRTEGRQYSAEVWHEYFKKAFLPEQPDPELTKDGYEKWAFDPDGDRVLIGSTTQLTVRGFSQYLEQVHAFGAEFGVVFHDPHEARPW